MLVNLSCGRGSPSPPARTVQPGCALRDTPSAPSGRGSSAIPAPYQKSVRSAARGAGGFAGPAGEILNELPGRAAGARAARRRPFERLAFKLSGWRVEAEVLGVAMDHGEGIVLAAMMEPKPEAEPVGQRLLLLYRFAGIDGGRALVVHHFARHEVTAVRGRIEEHVGRTTFDAAFERGLQRLIGRVAGVERQVVAE